MLPKYKIGTTVYFLLSATEIYQGKLFEINISSKGIKYKIKYKSREGYPTQKTIYSDKDLADTLVEIENLAYNYIDREAEKRRKNIKKEIEKLQPEFKKITQKRIAKI